MADIVILGMEMPETICGEPGYVDVRIFSDGSVVMAKAAPPYYEKFEAVPLPEGHGRLGDLDALLEKGMKLSWSVQKWVQEVDIVTAPTIVPAEGGTDDGV